MKILFHPTTRMTNGGHDVSEGLQIHQQTSRRKGESDPLCQIRQEEWT